MNTLTLVWILIVSSSYINTPPVVIAKFKDEKSCLSSAATMESRSSNMNGVRSLKGVCVPAENTIN